MSLIRRTAADLATTREVVAADVVRGGKPPRVAPGGRRCVHGCKGTGLRWVREEAGDVKRECPCVAAR